MDRTFIYVAQICRPVLRLGWSCVFLFVFLNGGGGGGVRGGERTRPLRAAADARALARSPPQAAVSRLRSIADDLMTEGVDASCGALFMRLFNQVLERRLGPP